MRTGLRIRTFIYALLYCAAAMGGMIYYADHKIIMIDNVAQDQVTGGMQDGENTGMGRQLRFKQGEESDDYLWIPLEAGVKAEDVTMENHYMDREIWIYIRGMTENYYDKEAVFGNISQVESGTYDYVRDTVLLKFRLLDVYECRSFIEDNYLHIEFVPPREMFDKIVVIDAGCGGTDEGISADGVTEKEFTLDIVKRLKLLLEQTDIKAYYTRTEDADVSAEGRVYLANAVCADMFISIRLNESGDVSVYGTETFYNKDYFIPGFGSVELADMVERNVVTEISGRGNGLFLAKEGDMILQEARVPAAVLCAGYATNEREAGLLQEEAYRERIAKGLYLAILEAYEQYGF